MDETLYLFEDVTTYFAFANTSIILFLNKVDIFSEKIHRGIDLRQCFPQYQGVNFDDACEFVKQRFLERVPNGKKIYVHFTCAIDTKQIEYVIYDVRRAVIESFVADLDLRDNI